MYKFPLLLIFLIGILTFNSLNAQNTGVIRVKNGSTYSNINKDVCYYNGKYYTLGSRDITCLDQNLNPVWTTSINTNIVGFSNASRIIITKDGNIVCAGITNNHSISTFVIKLRTDGTVIFQREYYLPVSNLPSLSLILLALSPAAGTDEGFLLGGSTCGHNNLLIKFDKFGNIEWAQHDPYLIASSIQAIYPENNSYFIVSNYDNSSNSYPLLWSVDTIGGAIWSHFLSFPYPLGSSYPKIHKLTNGKFGFICSSNELSGPVYICTLDSTGTNILFRRMSTYKPIYLYDFTENINGDLVMCGNAKAIPANDPNAQRSLYLYLKNNNTIAWSRQSKILTNLGPYLSVVHKTPSGKFSIFGDGSVVLTVDSNGNGACTSDSINITTTVTPYTEISPTINSNKVTILSDTVSYVVSSNNFNTETLCNTISVNEINNEILELKVFPNPNNGNFSIQLNNQVNEGELTIIDAIGNKIISDNVFAGQNDFKIEGLADGLYTIIITEHHNIIAKGKFMVQ